MSLPAPMEMSDDDETQTPVLPYEVIARVIFNLRDHKPTLATCMRVSYYTNSVATRYLYEQPLVLGNHNPFTIPISPLDASERTTPSKDANLRRIKELVIDGKQGPPTVSYGRIRPLSEPYVVDSVRIHNAPGVVPTLDILRGNISPGKMVLRRRGSLFGLDLDPKWRPTSMVCVMEDQWCTIYDKWTGTIMTGGFDVKPARAVYILWTSDPTVRFKCEADDRGNAQYQRFTGKALRRYTQGSTLLPSYTMRLEGVNVTRYNCITDIMDAVIHKQHPDEIIIVNAGQIESTHLPPQDPALVGDLTLDDTSVQSVFEKMVLARFDAYKAGTSILDRWSPSKDDKGRSREDQVHLPQSS